MKIYSILFVFISISATAQEFNSFYASLANQTSKNEIIEKLQDFENFGVKEMGSNAQENTRNWILNQYQTFGYTDIQQQEVTVFGQTGYNIIVTKQGTVYPDTFVILDGHYDTINGPGVNDNGSGTAILLETARILKDIPTEYSIKFIHFTGEEEGLIGSQKYVEQIAVPENLGIKLVLNVDEVGGINGEENNTVTCERDEDWPSSNNNQSNIVTGQLANLMELYGGLNTHISNAYASDYMPFQDAGFVITGLYETNESPYPHSSEDTFANLDPEYVHKITKGTIGAICYFSVAYNNLSVLDSDLNPISISPNPVDRFLTIRVPVKEVLSVKMADVTGKVFLSQSITAAENRINVSNLPNGVYFVSVRGSRLEYSSKIIVKHP